MGGVVQLIKNILTGDDKTPREGTGGVAHSLSHGLDSNGDPIAQGMDGDATKVAIQSQTFPGQEVVNTIGTERSSVTEDIFVSGDALAHNYFSVTSITATTKVDVSTTGTADADFKPVALEIQDDTTAGQPRSTTIAANKTGVYRGKFKFFRVRPNAATPTNASIIIGTE